MENWKAHLYCSVVLILIGFSFPISAVIVAVIFNTEITFDYISRFFLSSSPFLVFGILDISYALKHKHDKQYFPHGILFINRKNFDNLKNEGIIQGYGLGDYPYTLNLDESVKLSRIQLKNLNCDLKIENIRLRVLLMTKCRNLKINSNDILKMRLVKCSNISITNNIIQELRLEKSQENTLENNDISQII